MAGHLQARGDGAWRLHAYIGRDSAGRKRYASRTFRGTRRQAERALAAFVTEVERDRTADSAAEVLTVSQVLSRWLASRAPALSPVTVERYRIAFKQVEPALGTMQVRRLRPHHVEDLYAAMLAKGQSGASIRKVHWALRQSLAWAHRRGFVAIVATDGVELPPLNERKIEPPTSSDIRAVLSHLAQSDPDWAVLFSLVAWTGCRRGEVCGLHWEDVDLEHGSVVIRRAVVTVPGGTLERGTKTGEFRRIAIGTTDLLLEHLDRCAGRATACGVEVGRSAYVFSPDPASRRPYNPVSISRAWATACKAAGVPAMRVHDLRHHSATTLLKSGSTIGEVMDRHGWTTVQMINRYRHLLEAQDLQAAVTLENA